MRTNYTLNERTPWSEIQELIDGSIIFGEPDMTNDKRFGGVYL